MDQRRTTELSKFLSYVLRHDPEAIGLRIGEYGWADVDDLIRLSAESGRAFTLDELRIVVATNAKKRFTLSNDGRRIRAAQGHSLAVDLGLTPLEPPDFLFHGTSADSVRAILRERLKRQRRQHVHLSSDCAAALIVGARHGEPVVLRVRAGELRKLGVKFFRADNGVWLSQDIQPEYISIEQRYIDDATG